MRDLVRANGVVVRCRDREHDVLEDGSKCLDVLAMLPALPEVWPPVLLGFGSPYRVGLAPGGGHHVGKLDQHRRPLARAGHRREVRASPRCRPVQHHFCIPVGILLEVHVRPDEVEPALHSLYPQEPAGLEAFGENVAIKLAGMDDQVILDCQHS